MVLWRHKCEPLHENVEKYCQSAFSWGSLLKQSTNNGSLNLCKASEMRDSQICCTCGGHGMKRKVTWRGRNQESIGLWHLKYISISTLKTFSSPCLKKKLWDLFLHMILWGVRSGKPNIFVSGLKVQKKYIAILMNTQVERKYGCQSPHSG